ncbi:3,4-dioxygenase subunit beta [Microbacterium sp. 179-I 3D2 NHS]|uniref:dioxygenase family protein n=1 Tax=Microbacterium sp. 179-I 3D2 NHS TaxID=3235178 RepID=UPI0039A21958
MARIPAADPTPDGPAYDGRLLDRADEEVVDQGVVFDIRTLMSRRGVLGLAGLGAAAAVLAACTPTVSGTSAGTSTASATPSTGTDTDAAAGTAENPDETAGPYPGDGSNGPDVLDDSGIVRRDIRSSIDGSATAEGVPLTLEFQILDLADGGAPFAGVAVYAWHCAAQGEYSLYSPGLESATYLRGVQIADADGRVSFTSVFPGCATVYAESTYAGSAKNLAQVSLAQDNVFGDDAGASQLASVTGDAARGFAAELVVGVGLL